MINREKEVKYVEIKRFILDRFVFYSKMIFKDKDLFPNFKVYTREMMNNSIFDMITYMFGMKQEQGVNISTPKRWQDWIKKKYSHKKYMKWIIKRFPIKYNHHYYILNEYTIFPKLDLPTDFERKTQLVFYDYKYEGENIEDDKNID